MPTLLDERVGDARTQGDAGRGFHCNRSGRTTGRRTNRVGLTVAHRSGAPAGYGIHLMEADPHDGIAVMGTYRTSPVPLGMGFRLGLGEDPGDDVAVFGGVDVSGFLTRTKSEVPVEVLWFAGAGLGSETMCCSRSPWGSRRASTSSPTGSSSDRTRRRVCARWLVR